MSTGLVCKSIHCYRSSIDFLTNAFIPIINRSRPRYATFLHYRDSGGGGGGGCRLRFGLKDSDRLPRATVAVCNKKFSTDDSDDSHLDKTDSRYKLPRRLVKRLIKQGITEEQFVSKLKALDEEQYIQQKTLAAEQQLNSTVKEYLVNKLPHHSEAADNYEFPSDMPKYQNWEKRKLRDEVKEVNYLDPSLTSVVLFPGQGSQFIGMGKKLLDFPGVHELYEEASNILGYDLLKLCLKGPKSELDKTIHCQPSVMITSLAAVEKLREEHPNAIENCIATAGFSVGEFAALVFAGVLNFPDAVTAVKIRAEAMQHASESIASGMLTVFLAHDSNLKEAMAMAREYCKERRGIPDPICLVANYLFPECKVIAGHTAALEFIATNYKEFGLMRTKMLPVSGAFHTQLMKYAVEPLGQKLQNFQMNKPKIPVYSNLTGLPYHAKTNFPHKLGLQIVRPVKWEQTLHAIYSRSQGTAFPKTFEMGPSKQLGTFLKQVNLQASKSYFNIGV